MDATGERANITSDKLRTNGGALCRQTSAVCTVGERNARMVWPLSLLWILMSPGTAVFCPCLLGHDARRSPVGKQVLINGHSISLNIS